MSAFVKQSKANDSESGMNLYLHRASGSGGFYHTVSSRSVYAYLSTEDFCFFVLFVCFATGLD